MEKVREVLHTREPSARAFSDNSDHIDSFSGEMFTDPYDLKKGGARKEYSKWIHSQMSPCPYQGDL